MNWYSRFRLAGLVAGAFLPLVIAGAVVATGKAEPGKVSAADLMIPGISRYRSWACANPKPHYIPSPLAQLCRVATPEELAQERKTNPHYNTYIRVYVNDRGKSAFFGQKAPVFPVGTVIVKEKLVPAMGSKPALLTVMVKHEQGYDARSGDWEYLTLDGSAEQVEASGRLGNCRSCHAQQARKGYVFRDYLSAEIRKKMK